MKKIAIALLAALVLSTPAAVMASGDHQDQAKPAKIAWRSSWG